MAQCGYELIFTMRRFDVTCYAKEHNMWKKVKNSHDPDWVEYKTEKMTPSVGRISLSVWQRSDGCFSASKTQPNFDRAVTVLDATELDEAKKEAEQWCMQ